MDVTAWLLRHTPPRPLVVALPGGTGARLAVERIVREHGWRPLVRALPGAETIGDYRGLLHRHRWLAISLVVCLLGLVGTPPTGVFAGKLTVFIAAFDAHFGWLVVVAIINTVASLFYYLRWIVPAVRTEPAAREADHRWATVTAYLAALVSVAIGPLAGPILAALEGNLALL